MKNKHYTYMDVLRILSLALIIGYHFLADVFQRGLCEIQNPNVHLEFGNVHLVMIAVGIFFMLSGAGLMLAFESGRKKSLKEYYKGRFFKILIPFYITYISYLVFKLITSDKPLFDGVEAWKAIFTVCGVDEYLNMCGVRTFSLGIGEWFLGALIIMYLIFPLLYKLMKAYKWPFMIIATAGYVLLVIFYPFEIDWHTNALVKLYEFIVGMFLVLEFDDLRKPLEKKIPMLPTMLVITIGIAFLPIHPALVNTLVCTCIFLLGYYMEETFEAAETFNHFVAKVVGYSYYFFLVHHAVIYMFQEPMQQARMILSKKQLVLLFVVEFLVMFGIAFVIKMLSERLNRARIRQEKSLEK